MVMDLAISLVVLIIFIAVVFFLYKRQTHLSWIPKPSCHIIFGHYGLFKDSTVLLERWKDRTIRYGGMIRVHFPPMKPGILVTDPGVIRSLLLSDQALTKSKFYNFLKPLLGEGLLTIRGDYWKSHRRLINPIFGRLSFLTNYISTFESMGDALIDKIGANPNSTDLIPLMKMYTMDVICDTAMGLSSNYQKNNYHQYMHSVETIYKIVIERMCTIKRFDFIFKLTKDHEILTRNMKINDEFFNTIMEDKYNQQELNKSDKSSTHLTFLDMLLQLLHQGSGITKQNIKDEVNTMILGGHDTTSSGLSFTLYTLAHHPDIQEKVYQEQILIFGDASEPQDVSYDDLQGMRFLEMVIKEALRLYPPIPLIARELTDDIVLDNGSVLPKNLNVGIFIYACHRDPKYFPNPEVFDPNRFMTNDILPFTHFPFSSGKRNCIGRKFAMLQMKSCISKIIRNFRLIPSESEEELVLIPDVTLKPKHGLKIFFERRRIMPK